ncbi:MAG: GTPase ObgE [Mycoplasmoidaceae bacterium]
MLIDKCLIELKAGNGGDGIVSWRREAHYPEGGPWGGNGGDGGNIYFRGNHNKNSLFDLRYIKRINAEDGAKGGNKLCHGLTGKDTIIDVPLGTTVFDISNNKIIADIVFHDQKILICAGGKGGYGNAHFKSSYNKTPNLFERGDLGELKKILLELKYLCDVGIIGLPNAGKSTLLSRISSAKPKIAPYKFTTINPILGTVFFKNEKLVFADIPGLIEGASKGIGLGLEFLKHIERCELLIHLISGNKLDNESSVESYNIIMKEISKYNINIANKKFFLAISKRDVESFNELYFEIKNYLFNEKLYIINSLEEFPNELLEDVFNEHKKLFFEKNNVTSSLKKTKHLYVKVEKELEDDIIIKKINTNRWEVSSDKINYWLNKIPLTNDDNYVRFSQKINIDKIEDKIISIGGKKNDIFMIKDIEFIIG